MTELANILRQRIAENGPITVASYMADALCHPKHGYYTGKDPLGADGDFITSPEISQMFGELIGVWCAMVWHSLGQPPAINLVELGPGRGTLMNDLLRMAATVPGFGKAINVHFVENSPALRARQKEILSGASLQQPPVWVDDFESIPTGPMLVIANEFFDALPIQQFQQMKGGWCERLIDATPQGDFVFTLSKPLSGGAMVLPDLPIFPSGFPDAPEGSIIEVCPAGLSLSHHMAKRLVQDGGAALVIDYGHADGALGETLQALKCHACHDVLIAPGEADITAHVDFSALSFAAKKGNARIHGPVTQGQFLENLGISARADALCDKAAPKQAEGIQTALKRLIHDAEMGALFKVMAMANPDLPMPPGFDAP